jgi:uncharacterized membrane protein YfcA
MVEAILAGFLGGVVAGMLGVGGGVIFVPTLVIFLDFAQVRAEATSLLAIIPVALVGAYRQYGYGNVRVRDGLILGVLAAGGAVGGAALANELSGRVLRVAFAMFMLFSALQLVLKARRKLAEADAAAGQAPGGQ